MQSVEALIRALQQQVAVSDRVKPGELELATPCDGWTVREVLSHSIAVTLKFVDFATGLTDAPSTPAGDHVGNDHVLAVRRAAAAGMSAWRSVDMSRECRLPFGAYSAEVAAGINLFDVLAHTWDVAKAAGVPMAPDSPWEAALRAAVAVIGPSRDPRHYAPEFPVAEDSLPRERFLAFLGRRDRACQSGADPLT